MNACLPRSESPWLHGVWRRIYWLPRDWRKLHRLPWRRPALYVGFGGIGDELLCTGLIDALYMRDGKMIDVHARHPGLFTNNPGVKNIYRADVALLQTAKTWNADLRRPCEWQRDIDEDRQEVPSHHIIIEAAIASGYRGAMKTRPFLWLTPNERIIEFECSRPLIAIQSSGAAAQFFFKNKEWGSENFQEVVCQLSTQFCLVQLGAKDDPPLEGTIDRRGLSDIRKSAAILANSLMFIGQVGFLMHLARAVECRSVIVYGGREHPRQSGYPCNENLTHATPCSPCWQKNRCSFNRACLHYIKPADVIRAVDRLLRRRGGKLETEEVVI